MKKRNWLPFLIVPFTAAVLASCGTTSKTSTYDYDYLYIKKQGIIQRPLMADIEVMKEKKSLTRTYKNVTVNMAKEMLIADFIRENNADLIVQPLFSTKTENTTAKTNVEVSLSGYPANYRNIRNYEPKDSSLLLPMDHLFLPSAPSRLFSTAEYAPAKKKPAATGLSSILLK